MKLITEKQAAILGQLINGDEKYGLEMIRDSNGILKRGTIYVLLNRLEDKGLVKSKSKRQKAGEQGPARRVYQITGTGRKAFYEKVESIQASLGFQSVGVTRA